MANEEHLARLIESIANKDIAKWNEWRFGYQEVTPDLSMADLSYRDLHNADLSYGNLIGVDLHGARLQGVNLLGANLGEANLVGASMRGADLRYVNLIGAALENANFSQTIIGWTCFTMVNLSECRGLDLAKHVAPSSIDVDTIHRSQGKIPDVFLRGAGVPEYLIMHLREIPGHDLTLYSCFISYSSKDQEFADRLYANLQDKGVRCWFAPHDVQAGKKLHEQIYQAIRIYEKLLLILSNDSMNSEWVKTEIANARRREINEKRQMLFPVLLVPFEQIREWKAFDADTGKDSAREIREYFIPDFSNWKDHDSYQKAFDRLLQDLKAEGKKTKEMPLIAT
jgi:hypothetical protein